jgi:hypothetical protein
MNRQTFNFLLTCSIIGLVELDDVPTKDLFSMMKYQFADGVPIPILDQLEQFKWLDGLTHCGN